MVKYYIVYIDIFQPKADVSLDLVLIRRPILPYIITITTIGITKNTKLEDSHKPGGFCKIAQNAESGIVELSSKGKEKKVFERFFFIKSNFYLLDNLLYRSLKKQQMAKRI
jgi:hypothetical protein